MAISEENFIKELKKDEQLSSQARKKLDTAYSTILNDRRHPFKEHKRTKIYLVTATVNFLRFGKFTSETLNNEGFISEQQSTVVDQEITIQLSELYVDKNELGLHFTVQLPKNSELLNKKWEDYGLNFAIKNNENQYLVDFGSGLAKGKENLKLFRSINFEQNIDYDTNTLEFIYKLHPKETGKIPSLNHAQININGIVVYRSNPSKEYYTLHGLWSLPIDTSKINTFKEINLVPQDKVTLPITKVTAYPTSFVIRFKDEPNLFTKLPKYTGTDSIQLKVVKGNKITYYPYSKFISITESSTKYWDMTFDYSGYDQKALIYLELKGLKEIELKK